MLCNKNLFIYCLVFVFLFGQANAQQQQLLKKNWKAGIQLFGVGANYEIPIASQTSINFEASVNYGFAMKDSRFSFYGTPINEVSDDLTQVIAPAFSTEIRQYYNLKKRVRNNKSTLNNSGSFFSLTGGVKPKGFYSKNGTDELNFSFIPAWGMQRNVGKRINLDGRFGFGATYGNESKEWEGSINIRLGVAYVIK
ncbi:hypothetical protein [Niabella aquatica]